MPTPGTREYQWWIAGAEAETAARKEGRSTAGLAVRDLVDGLAENYQHLSEAGIAAMVYDICALATMTRWQRALAAVRVLRGRA